MTAPAGPRDLSRLLRPRSVAVVGGGWGRNVVRELARAGFAGEIWPVHPSAAEIEGLPAFRRPEDLPAPPDAAYVAVNREAAVGAVGALAAMGAGGAVCFASGFAEAEAESAGSVDLQDRLVAAAGTMPLVGPNCYGLLNYLDRVALWPDAHGGRPVGRGVAIVTQSSNIAINLTMQRRALPVAYVVTAGNQAQTGLAEIAAALAQDARVTALGLHVEGVGDPAALHALARAARARGLPVVVLKSGATEAAQAAALSHTASLAGSAAGARALFRRLGFGQAETLEGFLEALKLLHVAGPPARAGLALLSCSGGEAGLAADAAAARGLRLPPLDAGQQAALRRALGPRVALANPLDYHTYIWGDAGAMADVVAGMDSPALGLVGLLLDLPRADRCDPSAWDCALEAAEAAAPRLSCPLAVISTLPEGLPEPVAERLAARGIAPLMGLGAALEGIAVAQAAVPRRGEVPAPAATRGPAPGRLMDEAAAKSALAAFGLPVPEGQRVETAAEAGAAAARLGVPVAVKRLGLAHKSEAGAVALGLEGAARAEAAARAMGAGPYLIEAMVPGAVAELLVGVTRDPAHGLLLTLGAGGVLAELVEDTATLLLPAPQDEIAAALDGLRAARLLSGWRGRPAADRAAIVGAVAAVARFAEAHAARLDEVEVNPLLCLPDRAVAADALIRIA
ncbi:CoA-binding protein [Rhodosalinus halophilus]|uniref:CoA-binding protein n=1 Tax=Rhodosalinus halophilus TaxID=2259333 RepID=A0A365U567_9RHOB|nr:acetate--CoA ligase family protein [Rhodosalinus halophilus]RBI83234.1 CoA-binding protein [Rhodosalinus halophilus]